MIKRRMMSSGMLGPVALVRTDVSEELSASFIRVTRIGSPIHMLCLLGWEKKVGNMSVPNINSRN
jgi:hypothetical protein